MSETAPITPKEFAELVFDGKRSVRYVRSECRRYLRTRGKKGIAVIDRRKPYLIPRTEVARVAVALFRKSA